MKVLMVLGDGMRPDYMANVPTAQKWMAASACTLRAKTVFPSVTLPCHMSLFHSVEPSRHGVTTNLYTPQVRPINGLFDVLKAAGKRCAFFYSWEQLRDISRPGSLMRSSCYYNYDCPFDELDRKTTNEAIDYINARKPDFTFLYQISPDGAGHTYGWGSPEYQTSIEQVWDNIDRIAATLEPEDVLIVLADHGGHERTHGWDIQEDMTIPVLLHGAPFQAGGDLGEDVSIIDIAPTITKLLGVAPDPDWEGKSLF